MTDIEQLIAIAESMGFFNLHHHGSVLCGSICGDVSTPFEHCVVPDYLNDLNAMAEARKTFTQAQRRVFGEHLTRIVQRRRLNSWCVFILYVKTPWTGEDVFDLVDATGPEQCEAFLQTVGKWKE